MFNFLRIFSLLYARAVCELSEGGSQKWAGTEQLATYADKHKGLMVFLKDSKKLVNQVFGFRGFSPERQTLGLNEIEIEQRIIVRLVLLRRGYDSEGGKRHK